MKKPRRIRRMLKWAGVGACLLLSSASLASTYWEVAWISNNQTHGVGISGGGLVAGVTQTPGPYTSGPGWHLDSVPPGRNLWWFGYSSAGGGARIIWAPLWAPLVVITVCTAILFYCDRLRIPPGHCRKCGYNLTGNVSGRCPE